MLPKGTILGSYRLLRRIGVGGMGEVYLAEDTRITRLVAVKLVLTEPQPYPDSAAVQEASRLFRREMKAIATLDHRNILNLIDFGEETIEGMPVTYMIMPYRKEGSLNDWLQRYKTNELLSLEEIDYILSQAADALQHAHEHHIIHQDVKPSNFLIRENSSDLRHPDLFLTDFGVAKLTNTTASASQHVRGTPAFMPPEQWESQPVPATDQYALAILAYLFLTGRVPFTGRMEQVMRQHLMSSPQPPSTHNAAISPAVDAVILRALAKKPEERFPSILDFARAFHQAIQYGGDLRTTLTIGKAEALAGIERQITLPGGRRVSITVPQNAVDGQELRVEDLGDSYYEGGPRGPLFLKIAVPATQTVSESNFDDEKVSLALIAGIPSHAPALDEGQKNAEELLPSVVVPSPPSLEQTLQTSNERSATQSSPAESTDPHAESTDPHTESAILGRTTSESLPIWTQGDDTHTQPAVSPTPAKTEGKTRYIVLGLLLVLLFAIFVSLGIVNQERINETNNAEATAIAEEDATATVVNSNPDPYGSGGTLSLYDPLTQSVNWSAESNTSNGSSCQFMSDGYYIAESQSKYFIPCLDSSNFDNFVFEVKMKINKGDCGGMALRSDSSTGKGYILFICSDGSYQFDGYAGYNVNGTVLKSGKKSGISSGQNTIAVVANGSNFTIYLNNKQLDSLSDSTYTSGSIGLIASDNNTPTEVVYSTARVWSL